MSSPGTPRTCEGCPLVSMMTPRQRFCSVSCARRAAPFKPHQIRVFDGIEWYQAKPDGPWYRVGGPRRDGRRLRVCAGCGQEKLIGHGNTRCSKTCGVGINTYKSAHGYITDVRGRARDHACIDCAGRAYDWSYVGGYPDERVTSDSEQSERRWCLHAAEHYEPRCRKCHGKLDVFGGKGSARWQAKLNEAQIIEIRALYESTRNLGPMTNIPHPDRWTCKRLAEKFGVKDGAIEAIIGGQTWRHVTDDAA